MIRERRAGDIAANWCDASKAERMMGWKAQYDIADMCRDSWNWQSHNPNASPTPSSKNLHTALAPISRCEVGAFSWHVAIRRKSTNFFILPVHV